MNETQVNNFLKCFLQVDDPAKYLTLHAVHDASGSLSTNNSSGFIHHAHHHDHHDHYEHDSADHYQHRHADDDGHEHVNKHDLLVAKVTAMLVLFLASALCGSVPFLLNRFFRWTDAHQNAKSATVIKCLLYFGGGVLICTFTLHLLPEVQEVVNQLQDCNVIPELTFPLAELLMCSGFFLMYFIEEAIHAYIHHNIMGASAAFERGYSVRNSFLVKGTAPPDEDIDHGLTAKKLTSSTKSTTKTTTVGAASAPATPGTITVEDLLQRDTENGMYQEKSRMTSRQQPHHHDHDDHQHSHFATESSGDARVTATLRGLFIVLALSLHELFEGMAIGLERSASSVWFMFAAVSAHKLVLAFCVGVELLVARTRLMLSIIYVFTFAVVSPLGIGIGILISRDQDASTPSLTSAILQGLACGTLMYVVFFEILSKSRAGLLAYLSLFVGFLVMFGLQQLGAGGHGHSHGGCNATDEHDHSEEGEHHAHTHSHQHHDYSPLNENNLGAQNNNFEQQLQVLRQLSQKLLENHKKDV